MTELRRGELDAMMPAIYGELRRLAASYLRQERPGHTLQPTALVNETYLRMLSQYGVDFRNRPQVLGVAAQMMRRILRNHDEHKHADKRGGDATRICLDDCTEPQAAPALVFSEVDELLDRLAALDERQARIMECRIFGGMTVEETAEFLGVSVATVNRGWFSGRIWMAKELSEQPRPAGRATALSSAAR